MRSNLVRKALLLLAAVSLLACNQTETMSCYPCHTAGPPGPNLSAKIQVVPVAGGLPNLQVSASLANATATTFAIAQCPLVVTFSPYPPGSYGAGIGCAFDFAPKRQLAPGDTVVLARIVDEGSLASFAPGLYRVAVTVTYDEVTQTRGGYFAGISAGIVRLPLDSVSDPLDSTAH